MASSRLDVATLERRIVYESTLEEVVGAGFINNVFNSAPIGIVRRFNLWPWIFCKLAMEYLDPTEQVELLETLRMLGEQC